MIKNLFAYSKVMLLLLTLCAIGVNVKAQTNQASTATASTSYVSTWETLGAIKDGYTPTSSSDYTHGAYGNWNNPNSTQWVQYDWTANRTITSMKVYWWTDGGGILIPTTASWQYWNGTAWVTIGSVPVASNTFNTATASSITTTKVRLSMLNPTQSTGILEWQVFGTSSTDTTVPTTPGTPTASSITSSGCSLTWTASTDNVGVTGYDILRNGTVYTTSTSTSATITGLAASTTYSFTVRAKDAAGNVSAVSGTRSVTTLAASGGGAYTWPTYSPNISYNFKDEFPSLAQPTNILPDCSPVSGTQSDRWWCFRWGPNKNSLVTTAAITPLLARMNTDFAYFRDNMGWPPDLRAKNGYRSSVYLYGSGMCTDNASNTELGGWQSAIFYNNVNWPMVLASYYPIYSYDPACTYTDKVGQQGAMVHEGIHAVLADLPGVKQAAWFQEGGNVWLQQTADARRTNSYSSLGFLNGTDFIAPFMPIECYSGWLQDGSFGGPSAEGVNMFNGSQQICTWRTYLGGHQYSTSFPTFLGLALGDGSVPWIWRNAAGRVLEGVASGIGASQTRRLITEYRAKQAVVDFGVWKSACIALLDAAWGMNVTAEWQPSWLNPAAWTATPYVSTTNSSNLLTPEARTLPGWSGANQIPLTVTGGAGTVVTVNFEPIGANMTCQLVYRNTAGLPVYSNYVSSGSCSITLPSAAASNVVIAVITNTDYIYNGETTRTAHYDYRLRLVAGISGAASIYTKWYNSALLGARQATETADVVGVDWSKYCGHSFETTHKVADVNRIVKSEKFQMYPNPVSEHRGVIVEFVNPEKEVTTITVSTYLGNKVLETTTTDKNFSFDKLKKGYYIVRIKNSKTESAQKLIVE